MGRAIELLDGEVWGALGARDRYEAMLRIRLHLANRMDCMRISGLKV